MMIYQPGSREYTNVLKAIAEGPASSNDTAPTATIQYIPFRLSGTPCWSRKIVKDV